jgi:hypothetical protein
VGAKRAREQTRWAPTPDVRTPSSGAVVVTRAWASLPPKNCIPWANAAAVCAVLEISHPCHSTLTQQPHGLPFQNNLGMQAHAHYATMGTWATAAAAVVAGPTAGAGAGAEAVAAATSLPRNSPSSPSSNRTTEQYPSMEDIISMRAWGALLLHTPKAPCQQGQVGAREVTTTTRELGKEETGAVA